jgi:butyryl-CoA dehydrogenase
MGWQDGCSIPLTEEVLSIQQATREFASREILPLAAEIDKNGEIPESLLGQMVAIGLFSALVPEQYGGAGMSAVAYCLMIEELAAACASVAITISVHNSLCIWPIVKFGSDQQKQYYLPRLAKGHLGCFALSEPGTGSDAGRQTTLATCNGQNWTIQGVKNWITNGPTADICILFATTDRSLGNKGVVAFVHELSATGVARGQKENKLGICGSGTCSLYYDNVVLSEANLLNQYGKASGFKVAMETLNGGRIGVAAQSVGIARAALKEALMYSRQRQTFGKPISEHQSIANYLADMIVEVDASRYLMLGAAYLKDLGLDYVRQAAQCKLFASRVANKVAYKALQIHGGYGFVKDYAVERHFRDARITEIYEGTSEIQQQVIAARLLKEED